MFGWKTCLELLQIVTAGNQTHDLLINVTGSGAFTSKATYLHFTYLWAVLDLLDLWIRRDPPSWPHSRRQGHYAWLPVRACCCCRWRGRSGRSGHRRAPRTRGADSVVSTCSGPCCRRKPDNRKWCLFMVQVSRKVQQTLHQLRPGIGTHSFTVSSP